MTNPETEPNTAVWRLLPIEALAIITACAHVIRNRVSDPEYAHLYPILESATRKMRGSARMSDTAWAELLNNLTVSPSQVSTATTAPIVTQSRDGQAIPMTDGKLKVLMRFTDASSDFAPDKYDCLFDEGQRQMILLALHKLRLERPGWDYALGEIEQQLDGQIAWPDYGSEGLPNV